MTQSFTVFQARKILTMNPLKPTATHVAVREGNILAVGTLEEMAGWGAYELDQRFADKVMMPGLVEGHSHLYEGGLWRFPYIGYFDRRGPDGTLWQGLKSFDEVVDRLKEVEAQLDDPDAPLLAWGFDPIYFSGPRMTVHELDQVSTTRPVAVVHASFHLMNVNSAMLTQAGISRDTPIEGITCFPDGEPTGELCEFAAMFPVNRAIGNAFRAGGTSKEGLYNFANIAQLAGVTTAADLINDLDTKEEVEPLIKTTSAEDFPIRLFSAYRGMAALSAIDQGVETVAAARQQNTDKMRFGAVKLVLDGSIQGFTARVQWPGYYNDSDNGIWVITPEETAALVEGFHAAGLQLHIHTNGDEATEVALEAIEAALAKYPRWDHRHTLQHVQMASPSQFQRMAQLGVCANLFCNHIYYWGDAHYTLTMGPERAERMNACGTAVQEGVSFAMHSDAPITPIGPLFTAWCAVNRYTASGRVLGVNQRISVQQALSAITLGAANTLKMDDEIGSIEVGKFADFCVLEDDPLAVAPELLKDIPIWGTVLAGRVFKAPHAT
jgi:predicted amidohydrolase YtcJ